MSIGLSQGALSLSIITSLNLRFQRSRRENEETTESDLMTPFDGPQSYSNSLKKNTGEIFRMIKRSQK